jgi:hypothetical protein
VSGSAVVTGNGNVVTVTTASPTRFTSLSPADYAAAVIRERTALRRARRSALGLTDKQVDASFTAEPALPDALSRLTPGELVVLTGPLGSGKSDLADRWLLDTARDYAANSGRPIPLWLAASSVSGSLEAHVLAELGGAAVLVEHGVDLVFDGLDERLGDAASLLEQARGLVAAFPRSRAVLSAREGVSVPATCAFPVGPWDEDVALDLVAAVAGGGSRWQVAHGWPPSLRDAVRRPLFALLAGRHAADRDTPSTPSGLIDRAVRLALPAAGLTPALRRVALQRIRTGLAVDLHDVAPGEAAQLLHSRLLVVDAGRAVFALPLVEQWFAARAVLAGEIPVEEMTASLAAFGRWRYVLSVAVASGDPVAVDPLMSAIAAWNPGAAGWLVNEAISAGLGRVGDPPPGHWLEVGRAVRAATNAWATGLAGASRFAVPTRYQPGTIDEPLAGATLAVAVDGHRVGLGWAPASQIPGPVVHGPPHPFARTSEPTQWVGLRSGGLPPSTHWAWALTLNEMSRDFFDALAVDLPLVVPEEGVVVAEWAHARAKDLLAFLGRPLPARLGDLLPVVDDLLAQDRAGFRLGRVCCTHDELVLLRRQLAVDPDTEVGMLWPGVRWSPECPDPEDAPGTLDRVRAVYGGAVAAYREIAEGPLASFGETLGIRCLLPAAVAGRLTTPSDAEGDERPWGAVLSYELLPVGVPGPAGRTGIDRVDIDQGPTVRDQWDEQRWNDRRAAASAYGAAHPDAAVFAHWSSTQTVLHLWVPRPATQIALGWVHDDLKRVGWTDGTRAPDLR